MRSVVSNLAQYKSVHLNPVNVKYHFIGIPVIVWSILVLLGSVRMHFGDEGLEVSTATLLVVASLFYYLTLHVRLAFGALIGILPIWLTANWVSDIEHSAAIGIVVFIGGWVVQFIGHKHEKAKPAFFEDVKQLIIGPLFLVAEVMFYLGKEKNLERQISAISFRLRKEYEVRHRG